MFLTNALPASVLADKRGVAVIRITPLSLAEVQAMAGELVSAIGHEDTARIISGLLGVEIPMQRISIPALEEGGHLIAALYQGPRLPEGSRTLPEGAEINFFRVLRLPPRDVHEVVRAEVGA